MSRTVNAVAFSAYRTDEGTAYFTVQFFIDGVLHERREIYSGRPHWESPVYCIGGEHVTVLFPWAEGWKPERLQDHFESNICSALKGVNDYRL
jgi:hypothetical protein